MGIGNAVCEPMKRAGTLGYGREEMVRRRRSASGARARESNGGLSTT
jgi:hypothetical protein